MRYVIVSVNIVLRYEDWQSQCVNLIQLVLNFLSTPYTWRVQTVGLHAYRVDVTGVNRRTDKIHNGVSIPGHEVKVVINQNGVRAVLPCQPEGFGDPVVAKRTAGVEIGRAHVQRFVP